MQQLEQRMQNIERAMRAAATANRQAFLRVETVLGGVGRVEQAVTNLTLIARVFSQAHPSQANQGTHVPFSAPLRGKTPPPTPPDSKEKVFIFLCFCTLFISNEGVASFALPLAPLSLIPSYNLYPSLAPISCAQGLCQYAIADEKPCTPRQFHKRSRCLGLCS